MSDKPSTAPSLAKIDRADENILNLDALFSKFIEGRPYTVVDEPDPNPKTRGVRVTAVADVGMPFRVLVGEIAHHLRSAFDLMVYQLMLNAGITDDKRLKRCAFPVMVDLDISLPDGRKEYEHTMRRKIEGICPPARAHIESLQPCRTNGSRSFLAQIDFLDNTDKHRLLLALVGSVSVGGFNFHNSNGTVTTMPHKTYFPLEVDAIIKTSPVDPEVDVDFKLPIQITFGESGVFRGQPVIPKLQELSDIARATIHMFDKYF